LRRQPFQAFRCLFAAIPFFIRGSNKKRADFSSGRKFTHSSRRRHDFATREVQDFADAPVSSFKKNKKS
jgi:hypothetical protein